MDGHFKWRTSDPSLCFRNLLDRYVVVQQNGWDLCGKQVPVENAERSILQLIATQRAFDSWSSSVAPPLAVAVVMTTIVSISDPALSEALAAQLDSLRSTGSHFNISNPHRGSPDHFTPAGGKPIIRRHPLVRPTAIQWPKKPPTRRFLPPKCQSSPATIIE